MIRNVYERSTTHGEYVALFIALEPLDNIIVILFN